MEKEEDLDKTEGILCPLNKNKKERMLITKLKQKIYLDRYDEEFCKGFGRAVGGKGCKYYYICWEQNEAQKE